MLHHPRGKVSRDVDARVLHQRGHVVGRWTDHGILEVDDADAPDVGGVWPPDDVGRVEVAQQQVLFRRGEPCDEGAPDRAVLGAQAVVRRSAGLPGQVPVGEQAHLDLHGVVIEIWDVVVGAVADRDRRLGRLPVQLGENGDAFEIPLGDRPAMAVEDAVLTQILEQEDAAVEIVMEDDGRRKAADAEMSCYGDKGTDVLGDVGDLLVVLAVRKDRPWRVAWRIHQHEALAAGMDMFIGAGRCVAGQMPPARVRKPGISKESTDIERAADARGDPLGSVDLDTPSGFLVQETQRQAFGGQGVVGPLRPFHQADAALQRLVEAEFVEFGGIGDAV